MPQGSAHTAETTTRRANARQLTASTGQRQRRTTTTADGRECSGGRNGTGRAVKRMRMRCATRRQFVQRAMQASSAGRAFLPPLCPPSVRARISCRLCRFHPTRFAAPHSAVRRGTLDPRCCRRCLCAARHCGCCRPSARPLGCPPVSRYAALSSVAVGNELDRRAPAMPLCSLIFSPSYAVAAVARQVLTPRCAVASRVLS
jgi:hypothetical protein